MGGGGGSGSFKMGAVLPTSSAFGQTALNAVEVGINRINDSGGLAGEQEVELISEDSELEPGATQEKTNKLIEQDNVDILFGPLLSSSRGAMSPIAEQREIPLLYPVEYEGPAADDYCNEWVWKAGEVPSSRSSHLSRGSLRITGPNSTSSVTTTFGLRKLTILLSKL